MNEKIKKMIEQTDRIHRPIPLDESEMAELRMHQKPVLKSRLLDDMEDLSTWHTVTPYAEIELSDKHVKEGTKALKFMAPTNLEGWNTDPSSHMYNVGRIYAVPAARRDFDREDWREYNRVSAWIYPDCAGMKSITLRIQLFNDGARKVPDRFLRDGAHNMSLVNNQWNFVVLEFPYLDRDAVTGIAFEYDMVGHENDAVDKVTFYCDQLKLEEVETDVFEGWKPANDRISYSHSGYQPGATKTAIMSNTDAKTFRVLDAQTGRVVLRKEIETRETRIGTLQVMDFSEIIDEGDYILIAGELSTRTFPIRYDAWESSVWKVLNFYLVLRCGYEVPGKHRKCHSDMLLKHGDKSIVCDGGWHDAADLAQGINNTCDGTRALFALSKSLKDTGNDELFERVLEEAKWGLDYVLKMRFGDGYRATYSSASIWTDGIIGTHDDITMNAERSVKTNFDAAAAEAAGVELFRGLDDIYADYALKIAEEDFAFAAEDLDNAAPQKTRRRNTEIVAYANGASAAAILYRVTGKEYYKEKAKEYGKVVIACQEQNLQTDWEVPMVGYFYENRAHELIWHHNHHSQVCMPDIALRELCETFPDDEDYMSWYHALVLSSMYYDTLMQFTDPYGVIPEGLYQEDEVDKYEEMVLGNHPASNEIRETMIKEYRSMVQNGFKVGENHYVRVYPVWFSFRGNYNVLLSEGKAMSTAAHVRNNYKLQDHALKQFEWIIGKNPMAQSTMYGEGHDYIQLYAVQPGQTVGALSVGMESHFEKDEPYWPQVNNATYKEVWVASITKWMWDMADNLTPGSVSGYLTAVGGAPVTFTSKATGKVFETYTHPRTGYFAISLPSGAYTVAYNGRERELTVLSGKRYALDGALSELIVSTEKCGSTVTVSITANSETDINAVIKAENLCGICGEITVPAGQTVTVTGEIKNAAVPFVGLVIPNGNLAEAKEIL